MYETTLQRFGFVRTFAVMASCISSDDESAGSRFVPVQRSSLGDGVDERRLKGDIMMDAGYCSGGMMDAAGRRRAAKLGGSIICERLEKVRRKKSCCVNEIRKGSERSYFWVCHLF